MTEHYYTSQPSVTSDERVISVAVRGVETTLVTDRGVFSKGSLDDATRRLIEQVDLSHGETALDLGTGYGVVAAVLGRVFPNIAWTLIDINERAVSLAVRNTAYLGPRVKAMVSDGVPTSLDDSFDHVLLNPPIRAGKQVVYRLYDDAWRALRRHGSLWVVLQKKHGAPSTEARLAETFEDVQTVYKKSGYFIFRANKG
ncbi:class I SAM-dependent methyltransferase [Alicyclobacillus acidiphilus]|uniref:class I SAM-dependent methyltransferase n=1 Tax=Alicyclobacillus acidiphilus TaxID=182455 RepID=UPI0009FB127E|nr:methyltransferase [Alicyclobacillus acidiphilus]